MSLWCLNLLSCSTAACEWISCYHDCGYNLKISDYHTTVSTLAISIDAIAILTAGAFLKLTLLHSYLHLYTAEVNEVAAIIPNKPCKCCINSRSSWQCVRAIEISTITTVVPPSSLMSKWTTSIIVIVISRKLTVVVIGHSISSITSLCLSSSELVLI